MHLVRRKAGMQFVVLLALMAMSVAVMLPSALAANPKCFGRTATQVGGNGDDEINGTSGTDVIVVKGGNDSIRTGKGKDYVCAGGGGFDVIFLGRGNDKVKGQGGDDVIFPGPGADFVNGGSGGNFVTYEGSSVSIVADLRAGTINKGGSIDKIKKVGGVGGSEAPDVLIGNNVDNTLYGFGGNDELRGLAGEDFLSTGAGDDTAAGGDGFDVLDLLTAFGRRGLDDDVFAISGAVANLATATVVGGSDVGSDTISGVEAIGGTLGDDTLTGDDEANRLVAFSGDDELHGAEGDDSLEPGTGNDTVGGGEGTDLADYFSAGPSEGLIGPINIDLAAQTATGRKLGTDALRSIEGGGGTILDDTMTGSAGPDFLIGDDGSDSLTGGDGDDYLDGDAFFFGFPDNFSGPDALDGEGDTDTCLGGESVENCEETDPPAGRWTTLQRQSQLARSGAFHW